MRVIARRAPQGDRPLQWVYEYDEGIDPEDPFVSTQPRRRSPRRATRSTRAERGTSAGLSDVWAVPTGGG